MKILQIIIITLFVTSLLTLTGCEEPKGYLELKEPLPEAENLRSGKVWNVSDGFPDAEKEEE